MALEDLTGTKYLDSLVSTNPVGATDPKSEGDDHIRGIKNTLKLSFPAISGAVTATHTELNLLDGVTSTTSELNILDGVTSTTAELNLLDGVTATTAEINYSSGVTSAIQTQLDSHDHNGGDGGTITEGAHTTPTTGATYRHAQTGTLVAGADTSLTRLGEHTIVVQRTGVYQLSFEMRTSSGAYTATARIYRNPSTAYGGEVVFGTTQTTTSTTFVEKVEASLSLNAGDVLVLYASIGNAASNYEVQNFTLESAVKPFG